MPWLDRTGAGFVSALAYFWNQHGSRMNNLILVTCGSAASWILRKLLNDKGGLHNRITKRIELKPFTLKETAAFCQYKNLKFTQYQITQLYMVMGGIPFYWQAVEQGQSVPQAIDQLCFKQNGLLAVEFKPLFQSFFKNAENHIDLIEILAKFTTAEFALSKEYTANLRRKRMVFEQVTKTKKLVTTTLLTSYPALQNACYNEEIHSEVSLDKLF